MSSKVELEELREEPPREILPERLGLSALNNPRGPPIDLPVASDGAAMALNISENLPYLYTEIWYDAQGMEDREFSYNREEGCPPPSTSKLGSAPPTDLPSIHGNIAKQGRTLAIQGALSHTIDLVNTEGEVVEGHSSERPPPLNTWSTNDSLEDEPTSAPGLTGKGTVDQKLNGTDEVRWSILMNKLSNIENNIATVSKDLNALTGRVDSNTKQIRTISSLSTENEINIAALNKRYDSAWAEIDQKMTEKFSAMERAMTEANEAFQVEVRKETEDKVQEVKAEVQDDIIQGQCDHRKINLMLLGIPETESAKNDTRDLVVSFFTKRMSIKHAGVDIAYRLGKSGSYKPRPIMIRFREMAFRNRVWFSKSQITQKDYDKAWIQEDLPKAAKNSHRTFYRILKKAKSRSGLFPDAHIKGQSLFINGKAYGLGDVESLPEVLRPSNLAMLQSDRAIVFFGRFSPFSNHFQAPITINGTKFSCMEQYIAWSRATHAERIKLVSKALKPADPIVYKGILNELKANKSNDTSKTQIASQWYEQLSEVVARGLKAKFQQNPVLARALCNTYPKVMGEACYDTRWGIGLTLTDPDVLDTDKWPAEGNVMGKQLAIVRDELLATKNA